MKRPNIFIASAAALLIVLALPPVHSAMVASMTRHMLVQLPLLMAVGWLVAAALPQHWTMRLGRWNALGLTGLMGTALALGLVMIPRVLDLVLVDGRVELAKWLGMVACGVLLRLSWQPAGLLVQGFFLGNLLPMMAVVGDLYSSSPVRVCNAYLLGDQERLGQWLVWLAAALAAVWFAGLMRHFVRQSSDTERREDPS